ncbi:Dps family protein [Solirubrum puertoriconensis]|uniref:DNA starvation/stationary phase protection protein n=1 Tax=Solirubrum puertoriconensis TaxID=1751427 RepID=A0A9X0L3Y5_SOLP1|nr:Dps family protein [Solirubrum puertoriconensis]KUG07011.1 DNA starvation/stationary phase protection protein [Solirubrum puertoriconensis]
MSTKNQIGLDTAQVQELATGLNKLLANYQIFYINARGFHWNIKGEKFFELHAKFEEIYTDALTKIDEIAERILTLGHRPLHSFTDYLNTATIKEATNISGGKEAIQTVLQNFQALISLERELFELAGEANDEGTGALMSDYIRQQEKEVWMYGAYLG